jgi:hypothetical protein
MQVKDITKYYKEFIAIAKYHDTDDETAKDVVQDVFLKLCEIQQREGSIDRLTYRGKLNMVYIFNAIRNTIYTKKKKAKKMQYVWAYANEGMSEQPGMLLGEVNEMLQNEGAFFHKLYISYFNDKISIRKLSKETGIGTNTIFQGITFIKNKIKAVI